MSDNQKIIWRVIDFLICSLVSGIVYCNSPWWMVLIVIMFGLWSFTDGLIRAKFFK